MARALVVVVLMLIAATVIGALTFSPRPSETFTDLNAVLVLGYLLYPVLMPVAPVLLLVAVLFMIGVASKRRRSQEGR